jgi:hypothetical protein
MVIAPSNGLELSCPAEAGRAPSILAHPGGPDAPTYPPARRVSFSELLGGHERTFAVPPLLADGTSSPHARVHGDRH